MDKLIEELIKLAEAARMYLEFKIQNEIRLEDSPKPGWPTGITPTPPLPPAPEPAPRTIGRPRKTAKEEKPKAQPSAEKPTTHTPTPGLGDLMPGMDNNEGAQQSAPSQESSDAEVQEANELAADFVRRYKDRVEGLRELKALVKKQFSVERLPDMSPSQRHDFIALMKQELEGAAA